MFSIRLWLFRQFHSGIQDIHVAAVAEQAVAFLTGEFFHNSKFFKLSQRLKLDGFTANRFPTAP